jgi:ribokinase
MDGAMSILVFGSVVADMIFPLPHLPRPGETVLGGRLSVLPGGKGANQAVAAARDGARVAFAGAVGADALAETALEALRAAGVDLSRVARVEEPTACAAVCVDAEGRNQIAQAPGANTVVHADQVEAGALTEDTVLLCQMEVPPEETAALIARAYEAGALVILNLAPALPLPLETLRMVDVLVVNEVEATWLMGHLGLDPAVRDFDEPAPLDLAAAIGAPEGIAVVVTKAERGLDAISADGERISFATRAVKAKDTTGAGDCFTGFLAAGLDRELGFTESLWRAMLAATLSCTREGAAPSFPDAEETDAYLARG